MDTAIYLSAVNSFQESLCEYREIYPFLTKIMFIYALWICELVSGHLKR